MTSFTIAFLTNLLLRLRKTSPDPEIAYVPVPPTAEHTQRTALLGIEQSLLLPSLHSRSTDKPRSLSELPRTYRPARFRLTDASFDEQEKPDTWFEMLFVDVYAHVRRFASSHFGGGDIPHPKEEDEGEEKSLWLEGGGGGFGKTFLAYAGLVARQDNNLGGWEGVLRSQVERTAMVCGIVGKALEDGAWDRLLFGAGEKQERLLREMDIGTVRNEGFERTALRTQTINSLLGPAMLPPNFWPEVDALTSRILTLLLPLVDLLDTHIDGARTRPLAAIYADLHALVAEAGYLAVRMRRSDSIFRVVWPTPGDPSSKNHDHDPVCEVVYRVSKHAALAIEKGEADVAAQDAREEAGAAVAQGGAGDVALPSPNRVRIMAKVKLVLWPGFERYRRVLKGGQEGVDEVVVRKAIVGYYCGRGSDEADVAERRPRLREHVRNARKKRRQLGARLVKLVPRPTTWNWRVMLMVGGALLAVGLVELLHHGWLMYRGDVGDRGSGSGTYSENDVEARLKVYREPQTSDESWLAWLGRVVEYGLFRDRLGFFVR